MKLSLDDDPGALVPCVITDQAMPLGSVHPLISSRNENDSRSRLAAFVRLWRYLRWHQERRPRRVPKAILDDLADEGLLLAIVDAPAEPRGEDGAGGRP